MGLEHVELIMRAEEEFGICIEDAEAGEISTSGQLCALVERKLGIIEANERSFCPTSRAFYHMRRELVELQVSRASIRPNAKLEQLLARSSRRQSWQEIENKLGVSLPPLERSPEWAFIGLLPLGALPMMGMTATAIYVLLWWIGFHATKPADELSVPIEKVTRDADFSRDLGAG